MTPSTEKKPIGDNDVAIKDIKQLNLRSQRTLLRNGVTTLGVLALCTESEVKAWRGVGPTLCQTLAPILSGHKLQYRQDDDLFVHKVRCLYPDALNMPVGVLMQLPTLDEDTLRNLVKSGYGELTLRSLVLLREASLFLIIREGRRPLGIYTQRTTYNQVKEIKAFLAQFDLQLAT